MTADDIIVIIFAGGVTLAASGIGLLIFLRSRTPGRRANGD